MFYYRYLILFTFLFVVINEVHSTKEPLHDFKIYAFLPWEKQPRGEQGEKDQRDYLLRYGIHPIKIIYENHFLTSGKIDLTKMKHIADEAGHEPNIPVSFDIELGNRFKPETTIPKIKDILTQYRRYQSQGLVGIYATIPQNTYRWQPTISSYDKLNDQYSILIPYVDILSPSLYNYDGNDFSAWSKSAKYNMLAIQHYKSGKPIVPYISPIIRIRPLSRIKKGYLVVELDKESMTKRLKLLYDLGASGCIIWGSSQDRKKDGQLPVFDPNKGWGKAVVEFIQSHAN